MRKHPLVEFIKYIMVLLLLVTTMNPVVIGAFLICSLYMTRCKLWLVDLWVFSAVVVIDLFSSIDGVTFLAYHNYHIITFEALIYGILSGLRLVSIVNISLKFSNDVQSEKLVMITSYLVPPVSILISMTVRNVRRYSTKIKEIYWTQLSIEETTNLIVKFVVAVRSLSILIDWGLENGMETVASMEARGYGNGRRTYYKPMSLNVRDWEEIAVYIIVTLLFFTTAPDIEVIPEIRIGFSVWNTVITGIIAFYVILEEAVESKYKRENL